MKDQGKGINRKLTEAWACQDLYVNYNGCEIEESDFVDFEAVFGGNCVTAKLLILDNAGFTSTLNGVGASPTEGGIIKVGYTDCMGCPIEHEFVIQGIQSEVDRKDQKLVTFQLQDTATRSMKSSFVSKGYPDKKFDEAVTEHLDLTKTKGIKVIPPGINQTLNMVVGAGQDFFETLKGAAKEKGYKLIHDRKHKYLAHDEHLGFDVLKDDGEVFVYDTNQLATNRIVQFEVNGYNSDKLMEAVSVNILADDDISVASKENKEGIKQGTLDRDAKTSKNIKEISKGVPVDEAIQTKGVKQIIKSNEQEEYFNSLKDAQELSIWVPGRNVERVGVKVEVNLPRPKFYTQSEYDPVFSGKWEVAHVRDKIIGWYFMQELILRRPGK